MNPFRDWKKQLYISNKKPTKEMDDSGNYIDGFETPKLHEMNYQPTKSDSVMSEIGFTSSTVQRAVIKQTDACYEEIADSLLTGSCAYLNGASPNTRPLSETDESLLVEPKHGSWANYKVIAIRQYNLTLHIYFDLIQGR